ncbi:MAG: hypothetical protein P9L88_04665 [Candidatus Tantalella remota]|nr:hypothetical protein [Candidatus Tantalella remota]
MTVEYEPIYVKKHPGIPIPPVPNTGQIRHLKDLGPLRRLRYSNEPDFINPEKVQKPGTVLVDELEYYIDKYRSTGDIYSIHSTMRVLSRLILRMLQQEIRRYKTLNQGDIPDLYNASYVCLHQAMKAFDISKSSLHSFPRFLQGYIKKEVGRKVRWEVRHISSGLTGEIMCPEEAAGVATYREQSAIMKKIDVQDAMRELVEEGKVKEESMTMFKLKYLRNYTYQEIADMFCYSHTLARERIRAVVRLMKVKLAKYGSE